MKKTLPSLLFVGALALGACKTTSYEHTFADGTKLKATDRRVFVNTQADIAIDVSTNGYKAIKIGVKSDPNAEALKAVAEGVAKGVAAGVGKTITP